MMPWPNLTPQELAAYQMLSGGQMAQPGMAQQMQAYMAMMAQRQPGTGQMSPATGMQQPTMANMLAATPNASGAIVSLPTSGAGFNPGSNMSTILNNPQLMQLLMRQYGGGAGM